MSEKDYYEKSKDIILNGANNTIKIIKILY